MVFCSEPPIYAERAGARGFELTDARTGTRGLELTDARPCSFPNLDDAMAAQRIKAGGLGADDDFKHQRVIVVIL